MTSAVDLSPGTQPHPGRRSLRILTVGLCIGITAMAFEALAVSTAMPRAADDLGALGWYAWAFSIFQAALLFATVASGRLCDRIGPVRPMVAGMIIFGVGLVVAALAPTMPVLVLGRGIQGLGSGTMGVALYVVIAHYYRPELRPRVLSWISTAWVLPGFLGPLVSGWLTEHFSWHWVFGAVIPVLAVAAALLVPILVRSERGRGGRPDGAQPGAPVPVWAAALVALSIPVVQIAFQRPGWWTPLLLVAGGGLLLLGLPRLMAVGIWRMRPGLGPVFAVRGLIGGTYFATEAFAVLMLVEMHHLDLRLAGLVLTLGTIGWTTGAFVQARWHIRRDLLMTVGAGSITAGVAGVAVVALSGTEWFWLVGVVWTISALGMGTAYSSTSVATMRLSPDAEQGRNAASLQVSEALGASLLSGLAGAGYAYGLRVAPGNLAMVFGLLFVGLVMVALLAVLSSRRIGVVEH